MRDISNFIQRIWRNLPNRIQGFSIGFLVYLYIDLGTFLLNELQCVINSTSFTLISSFIFIGSLVYWCLFKLPIYLIDQ